MHSHCSGGYAGGRCCVNVMGISGGLRMDGWEKMNHNEGCGSFLWRTAWASHFLGPPLHFSIPNSSVDQLGAAHIPLKREGAGAARIRVCVLAGGIGDQAHITLERGGAPGWVDVRYGGWIEVVRTKMVVVGWEKMDENQPWCGWWRIKALLAHKDSVQYECWIVQ